MNDAAYVAHIINVFLNNDVKIKAVENNWDEGEDSRVVIFPQMAIDYS